MKTTLKRGIGRSGSPNGNGRAVLPPAYVPPVVLYRQPARRRSLLRTVGKVVAWLLAAALVVASGLAGGAYLYLHEDVAKGLAAKSPTLKYAENSLNYALPDEPATALVVGYDRRAGEVGNEFRSDTIMLVRADPHERTLSTLSFPRDLLVEVRCPGEAPYPGRINEAFSNCRERGTLETVRALTGNLPIHYLVTVNFRGFTRVVAKLGGVWMDVDRRYLNTHTGPTGYAAIDLQPGYQKLNGQQALDFVRYRHTDSDLYRIARQQLFVEAFKESVTTGISITNVLQIVNIVKNNVEVGLRGGGGPSLTTLREYAQLAYQLPNGHFFQSRIRPEDFVEDAEYRLIASQEDVSTAVYDFTHPQVERVRGAAPPPPPVKAPPARETTVLVLNGNGVPGSAATTSDALRQRDYRTITPPAGQEANAPKMDYANSQVYFRRGDENGRAAAEKLAELIGRANVVRLPRQLEFLSNGAMVTVIVGRSFGGLAPPPGARPKERPEPANVVRNPGETAATLQTVRGRVPFRLMLPHVIERTSSLDDAMPVRVYNVDGKRKAVRLVYELNRGADEYWGIQMTNWADAPVLAEPNRRRKIGKRTYDLYYTGKNLRMVALRQGDTSYWVVNTLLNRLSNRTMLAIAKGLKPLRG